MKAIIVEDEVTAAKKLASVLETSLTDVDVIAYLESVKETVKWLSKNESPDIGFFDIQLSDATSFEIFNQVDVKFPVVFVTAYDDYLLRAFDYNAVHYVLKPVVNDKVELVLGKIKLLKDHFVGSEFRNFLNTDKFNHHFRSRLLVQKGLDYFSIPVGDIAYFFSERKITFARMTDGETYIINESMSALTKCLDPSAFYRLNRQFLTNITAIKRFRSIDQSKIALELVPKTTQPVIISKENAVAFRQWIKDK